MKLTPKVNATQPIHLSRCLQWISGVKRTARWAIVQRHTAPVLTISSIIKLNNNRLVSIFTELLKNICDLETKIVTLNKK